MKVEGPSGHKNISSVKKRKDATGSSDFLSLLSGGDVAEASSSTPAADITPVSSLDSLLSLQEMPDEEVRVRRAISHGKAALDELEQLRHALLMGTVPQDMLGRMNQYIKQQRPLIDDPRLAGILDDIELRVAVELAKLERSY